MLKYTSSPRFTPLLRALCLLVHPVLKFLKNAQINRVRHDLVPQRIRMQMVSRIIERIQNRMIARVPHGSIKVHDRVEPARVANPRIDALPGRLAVRIAIGLAVAAKRRNGHAKDGQALGVHHGDDLVVRREEARPGRLLGRFVGGGAANVVDALKEHGIGHARLGQDVPVDAAKGIGPVAVVQHAVAPGRLVDDGRVLLQRGRVGRLQAAEQVVGPSVVGIVCAAAPVGDAVAHDGEGARA